MSALFREQDLVWYRNPQNKFWLGTITTEKRSGIWKKENQVFVEAIRCPGDKSRKEPGSWAKVSDLIVFVVDESQIAKFSNAKLAKVYAYARKEYQRKPKLGLKEDVFVEKANQNLNNLRIATLKSAAKLIVSSTGRKIIKLKFY